jgi:hypothetical protein
MFWNNVIVPHGISSVGCVGSTTSVDVTVIVGVKVAVVGGSVVVWVIVGVTVNVVAGVNVVVGEHIVNAALDIVPWLSMAVFMTVPELAVIIPTHDTTPFCPAPRVAKFQFMTLPLIFPPLLIDDTFICAGIVSHME